jgi:hypothetical protein
VAVDTVVVVVDSKCSVVDTVVVVVDSKCSVVDTVVVVVVVDDEHNRGTSATLIILVVLLDKLPFETAKL